jgi:hypothetical protein
MSIVVAAFQLMGLLGSAYLIVSCPLRKVGVPEGGPGGPGGDEAELRQSRSIQGEQVLNEIELRSKDPRLNERSQVGIVMMVMTVCVKSTNRYSYGTRQDRYF